jgi:hypothetical protein
MTSAAFDASATADASQPTRDARLGGGVVAAAE